MSRKDVTDKQVCEAYQEHNQTYREAFETNDFSKCELVYDMLSKKTGEPWKVCYRAMERAYDNGFIEYGTSLRAGWLTKKGAELIGLSKEGNNEAI